MKKLFLSTNELDKNCIENLGLSELVLQENAALGVANLIRQKLDFGKKILFLCGGGNNASDAIAAARMLSGEYECELFLWSSNLNQNAKIQLQITENVGVKIASEICEADCYVDGLLGSGLDRDLPQDLQDLLNSINQKPGLKIAVDVPTGLNKFGRLSPICFKADFTVTMGARKIGLYSDLAKDFVGEIKLANLGICEDKFSGESRSFLLEMSDLELPKRDKQNVSKGDFGHAFVACGMMSGAAKIVAKAALKMGAGRVSVVNLSDKQIILDDEIMLKNSFKLASSVAIGMGLGVARFDLGDFITLPCVVDADMFYRDEVFNLATSQKAVLTPHPKEFANLLKIASFGEFSVEEVQSSRLEFAIEFSSKFACVLVLKGANTLIAQKGNVYISPFGTPALSVGGSGDALSGIILGLLAQGYSPLNAAISGVLAHAKTALNFKANAYSFTPNDIIEGIKWL
ncbi:carbohydrate kinase, YjeF-related protein [Campylobacter iguaniorum]|uniref:bifunctional ADP-dependent NAD(P)H-hydrate dehydratase/NAD(P)H-hydrate epimerase n=1 Tax=Campylobacter iguaniorum TaxID=1244531 RepID=UPI00073A1466|nr:bifunctional ADP-dependent NAD(P)H-hydrate dehydratase/NAD(P)H-hydrate epimerase [Campylobacter iguaniorum]ALV25330.1 carbohydrate kinase, YjeF-related protein [Campylobacter iguaniorum]